jgi:catechol 2,3-dioxygenase-like lactoylglutathione lyase family enzyme
MTSVDHVGVVVPDLDRCVSFMERIFGARVERRVEVPDRVRAVFLTCGGATFEIMQRLDPNGSTAPAMPGPVGPQGVTIAQHIALVVHDMDAEKQRLASLDVPIAGQEGSSGGRRTVYINPEAGGGLTYQLIEMKPSETNS